MIVGPLKHKVQDLIDIGAVVVAPQPPKTSTLILFPSHAPVPQVPPVT